MLFSVVPRKPVTALLYNKRLLSARSRMGEDSAAHEEVRVQGTLQTHKQLPKVRPCCESPSVSLPALGPSAWYSASQFLYLESGSL